MPRAERVLLEDLGLGFHRAVANYGYMESPNVPDILEILNGKGLPVDVYSTSFFLGRETILPTGDSTMVHSRKTLFAFMSRNAWNATSFFMIPPDRVVELGSQVEL